MRPRLCWATRPWLAGPPATHCPTACTVAAVDVVGCLACDLTAGQRPLPGGPILDTSHWRIEHCVGPLGVGTLVLKPFRHVTRVSELTAEETAEQGPLLHRCATVIDQILAPAQVYICLWSHAGGEPGHIHYVVQPVSRSQLNQLGLHGPRLQVAMFDAAELPPPNAVELFAEQARGLMG